MLLTKDLDPFPIKSEKRMQGRKPKLLLCARANVYCVAIVASFGMCCSAVPFDTHCDALSGS